jgi:Sensors of blue-light using FAD
MFFMAYVSSAAKRFSHVELVELLTQSREKNAKLGITGMLLYKDGNFMQVLEGEEAVVRELLASIWKDERHHGIITIMEEVREEREFPEWSMGFYDLESPEVLAMPTASS